jgi:hypothetical protein
MALKMKKSLKITVIFYIIILVVMLVGCDLTDEPDSADNSNKNDSNDKQSDIVSVTNNNEEILGEWIKIQSHENEDFTDMIVEGFDIKYADEHKTVTDVFAYNLSAILNGKNKIDQRQDYYSKYIFRRDGTYTQIISKKIVSGQQLGFVEFDYVYDEGTYELTGYSELPELDRLGENRRTATLTLYPDTDKAKTYEVEMDYSGLGMMAIQRLIFDDYNVYRKK